MNVGGVNNGEIGRLNLMKTFTYSVMCGISVLRRRICLLCFSGQTQSTHIGIHGFSVMTENSIFIIFPKSTEGGAVSAWRNPMTECAGKTTGSRLLQAKMVDFLGTGSVWKSPDFDRDKTFIANFSEWQYVKEGDKRQRIFLR